MTTPITAPCALPGLDRTPGAPETAAPADAFAALLAALTGGVAVPPGPGIPPLPGHVIAPEPSKPGAVAMDAPSVGSAGLIPTTGAALPHATTATGSGPRPTATPAPDSLGHCAPVPVTLTPAPVRAHVDSHPAVAATAQPAPSAAASRAPGPATGATPTKDPARAATHPEGARIDPPPSATALEQPQAVPAAPTVQPPAALVPSTPGPVQSETRAAGSTSHVRPALVEAAKGLRHEGGGRTSLVVRLDPPELGAVLVRLTVQDGRVDVQLRTPDLAARSDLQAQSYDVQQVLREQGLDLTSFDVAHGDVLTGGREDAGTPDRGTPGQRQTADGRPHDPRVTDDALTPELAGTWL